MKKYITYIELILAAIFWGVSFILTKQIFNVEGENMSVTMLVFLRLALASVVSFPLLIGMRRLQKIRKGDLKWFLLLALTEPFVYHLLETSGVQLVSGSLSSVVIATIPLFVPFGMALVYRERLSGMLFVGILLSLVGIAVMLLGDFSLAGTSFKGLLCLAGAVLTAVVCSMLLVRMVKQYNSYTITTWQNLIGLGYFAVLIVAEHRFSMPSVVAHFGSLSWSWQMIWPLLTLGVFCSTFAYMFYNQGVKYLGASRACIFNNTIPIFSFIAAILIGQEGFSWLKLLGVVVVIAGVVLSQMPIGQGSNPRD